MAFGNNQEALKEKILMQRKDAFQLWMMRPTTRLMTSMIPKCDKPEVLQTLLQEAFDAGFDSGGAEMAVGLLQVMMRDGNGKDRDKP